MTRTSQNLVASFSHSYPEARAKFKAAAVSCGARLFKFVHPQLGSAAEELSTDVAVLGDDSAGSLLVLVSGTHGVEGYLGSAMQVALMNSGALKTGGENISVALVHGLNPHGFSLGRRVNEDNVDVNRNFVNFSARLPANEPYLKLHDVLMARPGPFSRLQRYIALAQSRLLMGQRALQSAIANGQYVKPDGLFYGGHSATWSRRVWQDISSTLFREGRKALVIDYHTGLGNFAMGEVTCPVAPQGKEKWFSSLLQTCFDVDKVKLFGAGSSVSTDVTGDLLSHARLHSRGDVAAIYHEFGTHPPLHMLEALISENWAHHHCAPGSTELQTARLKLRDAFYPQDQRWKSEIWIQAESSVIRALKFLAGA